MWIEGKKARAPQLVGPWVEAIRKAYGAPDTKYVCVGECVFCSKSRGGGTQGSMAGYCFGAPYVCEYLTKDWILAGEFHVATSKYLNDLTKAVHDA